ncbi:MAG: TetR/AcrR family transcriptional regulator [Alphaproteobacteria bacterium]|nr:TetR/AcrR family transcriptional regulator [Alphaproteobacteria bacterium]
MNALQPSRREQAKDGRRNRIIDAANDLIKEIGIEDLSVRMIADRADVSPATVYNLFRNKAAVLFRVYQRRVVIFDERVAKTKSADALERIFDAAAHVADLYRKDPGFYRAFIGLRLDVRPESLPARESPGAYLWRKLVREAIAAGELVEDKMPTASAACSTASSPAPSTNGSATLSRSRRWKRRRPSLSRRSSPPGRRRPPGAASPSALRPPPRAPACAWSAKPRTEAGARA